MGGLVAAGFCPWREHNKLPGPLAQAISHRDLLAVKSYLESFYFLFNLPKYMMHKIKWESNNSKILSRCPKTARTGLPITRKWLLENAFRNTLNICKHIAIKMKLFTEITKCTATLLTKYDVNVLHIFSRPFQCKCCLYFSSHTLWSGEIRFFNSKWVWLFCAVFTILAGSMHGHYPGTRPTVRSGS